MVLFNYSTRELTAKIVYYGPGLCGKTTNLQHIFDNLPGSVKGKMLSLATKTDRTLFFDFLPLDLGEIRGMKTRIQLYTVPGQVFYNETRRLVLKGADGVVFVADSQKAMVEANLDSYRNLEENLRVHSLKLSEMPLVLQYNKRDLPNLAAIEELNASINRNNSPFYESVATTGIGVQDTLKAITKLVLLHLTKRYDAKRPGAEVAAPLASTASVASSVPAAASAAAASGSIALSAVSPAFSSAKSSAYGGPASQRSKPEEEEDIIELTDEYTDDGEGDALLAGEQPIELEDEIEDETMAASPSSSMLEQELEIEESDEPAEPMPRAGQQHIPIPAPLRGTPTREGNGGGGSRAPLAARTGSSKSAVGVASSLEVSIEESTQPASRSATGAIASPPLAPGQEHEIQVPVEIEVEGRVKHLTLSIRLRLSESKRLA